MNIDDVIRDKEMTHGPFADAAPMAQALKAVMRRGKNWEGLNAEAKEALEMTATLLARILAGDATDPKHWNTAAGYLRLRGLSTAGNVESGIARIARNLQPLRKISMPDEPA